MWGALLLFVGTGRVQGPKVKKEALLKFGQDKAKGKK